MLFGKTRHAFYDKSWHEQRQQKNHYQVLEMVSQIRTELPRIGTPKLYYMLKKPLQTHGIKMGRHALHHLLLKHGMTVRPSRRYIKTTNSNHWMKKYPNLIKDLVITESEQLWVCDITYIQIGQDFNFLSLITDYYSKLIVGYCLYPTLEAQGCLNTLRMALAQRLKPGNRLIHHSDRGTQYCSSDYVQLLQASGIEISMTEKKDPYENAVAERVNGILKYELELNQSFKDRQAAVQKVEKSILAYNHRRPHMSCNYLTPAQAHQMTGVLENKWKPRLNPKPSLPLS